MPGVGDHLLVTGATGFLGGQIVKRILLGRPSSHLAILVRSTAQQSPRQRADELLARLLGAPVAADVRDRVEVVEGDIAVPGLGLALPSRRRLQARIDHVIHCAATIRFDLPLEVARRHNTEGTRHVLELGDELPHLRRLDYVGTAYVAGRRAGLVREDELDVGQRFWNSYERTKLEAETLVREFAARKPATIHRPSIVVGDSRTGETAAFQGLYQLLPLYTRRLILAIPADPSAMVDLVPIDYVLDAFFALVATPRSLGRTFHLVSGPGKTSTFDELLRLTSEFTGVRPPPYVSLETYRRVVQPLFRVALWGRRRAATRRGEHYLPYLSSRFVFDKTNVDALLEGSGVVAPHPQTYFKKLIAYQAKALGIPGLGQRPDAEPVRDASPGAAAAGNGTAS